MMTRMVCAFAAGMAVIVLAATAADAQARRKSNSAGHVTTCSDYGNGCTSAPVRRGRHGHEYRMPRGTWVSCRRNCRNALREDTVDFWETQRQNQRD
jgi:hypothetical protein